MTHVQHVLDNDEESYDVDSELRDLRETARYQYQKIGELYCRMKDQDTRILNADRQLAQLTLETQNAQQIMGARYNVIMELRDIVSKGYDCCNSCGRANDLIEKLLRE